jgi:hypothetical protein
MVHLANYTIGMVIIFVLMWLMVLVTWKYINRS